MRSHRYFLLLILTQVIYRIVVVAGYGVNVSLTARWTSTSLALEGLEFLADVGAAEFDGGLKALEAQRCAPKEDAGVCWEGLLESLSTLLPASVQKLFKQHLATRHYSPRVETFSTLYLQESLPEQAQHACAVTMIDGFYVTGTNELQARLALSSASASESSATATERLPIDHVFHAAESESAPTVVLYGAPGTTSFHSAHTAIQDSLKASSPDFHYIMRPVVSDECLRRQDADISSWLSVGTAAPVQLAGYGVELFIKSTEYNQVNEGPKDATEAGTASPTQAAEHSTVSLTAHLEEEQDSDTDIKINRLGLQTAQLVAEAEDPLAFLAAVTSRFPAVVQSISNVKVNASFSSALDMRATVLPPGQDVLLVNGVSMRVADNINLATLESLLRADAQLAHTLHAAGMHAIDAGSILKLRALDRSSQSAIRLDLRTPHCFWLNDLEHDAQYRDWPTFLSEFVNDNLRHGGAPKVARNAINLQLIMDPLAPRAQAIVPDVLEMFMQGLPVRIGALFIVPNTTSPRTSTEPQEVDYSAHELFLRLFIACQETHGSGVAWQFWYLLIASPDTDHSKERVLEAFEQVWSGVPEGNGALKGLRSNQVIAGVQLGEFGDLEEAAQQHAGFVRDTGFTKDEHFAFNGKLFAFQGRQQEVLQELAKELEFLQRKISTRELRDSVRDIYGRFVDEEGAATMYSELVLYSGAQDEELRAAGVASEVPQFQMSEGALGLQSVQRAALPYLHGPGSRDNVKVVSMWLAVDLSQAAAAELVHNAAQFIAHSESERTRLSFLFNDAPGGKTEPLARFLVATTSLSSRVDKVAPFLITLAGTEGLWQRLAGGDEAALEAAVTAAEEAGLNGVALKKSLGEDGCCNAAGTQRIIAAMHSICDAFGLKRAQQAAATNGRLLALPDGYVLTTPEIELMQYVAYRLQPGQAVLRTIQDAQDAHRTSFQSSEGADELSSEELSDLALLAASVAARPSTAGSEIEEQLFSASNMHISGLLQQVFHAPLPGRFRATVDPSAVAPVIQAVINPVSTTGRQLSHLVQYLHSSLGASVDVILNPERSIGSMPLNSFYAFAAPHSGPSVGLAGAQALLPNIPGNKILTMSIEVPEAWLVEVVSTTLDTDNLRLDDLGDAPGMDIGAELEAIMLTGACMDTAFNTTDELHPRGTQLVLQDPQSKPLQDTLVMSNLGYFQLKTTPGRWQLKLAPGRSEDIFDMVHGDLQSLLQQDSSTAFDVIPASPVLMHSLSGLHMRLLLRKKEEFKGQDVLQIAEKEGRVSQEGEVVNIFAIASGHMYERLQKIMILSVLRHTNAKVKFWLIKNYMSPEMKRMMPLMADQYGFEVEMVTYKWPSWLHRQTEKQRIIWAYKILFLDVLFPLNVSRIIFCDSDQIIRTDLAELFHMDLEGKPVAYTPFCDNNKDMDGYRFWKGGFWEKHLGGKSYHISALYLVDVDRLRQMAGGDMYRVIYDRLSKDPGSLSNLDQDLPNYAQHHVPIHSLPQEWLWCESWCGTETKAKAKTIDLCNNPATKEPKLQAARRIVAEWPEYDAQVARFTEEALAMLALQDGQALPQTMQDRWAAMAAESNVDAAIRDEF